MSVKLIGHRVHPMLVGFPLGLLGTAVVFDFIYLATKTDRWADLSFCLIGAGVVSGLVAAPFGTLDWLGIPGGTRAKKIGLYHGIAAVVSVILFATSWWLRYATPTAPEAIAISLSVVAVVILALAGWLGGELVERLGIGIDEGAHPNSPSSISGRRASEQANGYEAKQTTTGSSTQMGPGQLS